MSNPQYNPPRAVNVDSKDPLEIDLVYNVRSCGTCKFFWPDNPLKQPYGPYPSFDFDSSIPKENQPEGSPEDYLWLKGKTREEAFPNGEVMDGCRKAPIMTIGINPNMTAFAPGLQGTSWAYPNFTSDDKTDAWTKYAYYYRYRSVYQEHLDLDFVKQYLLPEGQILAEKDGKVVSAERTNQGPDYSIEVRYDGDSKNTVIPLNRKTGTPRYVLLYNHYGPDNVFKKGDVIAARLNVPADVSTDVYQEQIGYYEQFVPTLDMFSTFLKAKGMKDADIQIGEDVGQLDMVACASPHWNEDYLGNQEETIVNNCVSKNSWAIKQMVQTKPVVLYLVGESSWNMFRDAFEGLIDQKYPMPKYPKDGAFTLFKETISDSNPCYFKFSTEIDGRKYELSTRLIVTPHFSYNTNFLPQFRMSGSDFESFKKDYADCYAYFEQSKDITIVPGEESEDYTTIQIVSDTYAVFEQLEKQFAEALKVLSPDYYNPHRQMAEVLESLYDNGALTYKKGNSGEKGYLTRAEGACSFCVNDHWEFPLGCPYKKPEEPAPPVGFLKKVAAQVVAAGKTNQKK
ncbi:hypothetical protein [Roseivirga sp. E12]|uniref:hypothetical protein n=1 Tax=Roseivirga sp. E12 TaxID=2819237 RepID=UPI001ABCE8B3|nr:hypothetical protein [Roseivirga sp. E12]MBO3696964.1 hypothetical protein [Roseivirga sp. E12]